MDVFDEDMIAFWASLNKFNVEYIMVGGFATNLHGFSRITSDVDIWLKDTPDNRKKFRAAYADLGLGDFKELETIQFVPGWTKLYLHGSIELDVMTSMASLNQTRFNECYKIAPTATIHGVDVRFLHINHLIDEKKLVGRPKDLLDVEELEKIKRISEENDAG